MIDGTKHVGRPKEPGVITHNQEKALRLLGRGLTPAEIAEKMNTTRDAVNMQMRRTRMRLGARNNVQAVIKLWASIDP